MKKAAEILGEKISLRRQAGELCSIASSPATSLKVLPCSTAGSLARGRHVVSTVIPH
jgi:hypothetical protein